MKIIITSGGTREKIDDVRMITNMSTGKLGCLIAQAFYSRMPSAEIIYLCAKGALLPELPNGRIIKINSVQDTLEALETILTWEKIDAVIHAMAVSDYAVKGVTTAEALADAIALGMKTGEIRTDAPELPHQILRIIQNAPLAVGGKISSRYDNLMLLMEKTPKLIGFIKRLQPAALLVGFKLLNGTDQEVLIETGRELLVENQCDFVLANDLSSISGDLHKGFLIRPDGRYWEAGTKEEIASLIAEQVLQICTASEDGKREV